MRLAARAPHRARSRRRAAVTWGSFAAVTGTIAVVGAVVGALGAAAAVARGVVTPPREKPEEVVVHSVDRGAQRIRLSRTRESLLPGRYSLWFDGGHGHARVGTIVGEDADSVTRILESVEFGDLERATRARWGAWYYLEPADLDVTAEDVVIETSLGGAPAWLIRPDKGGDDWIIQVHGRGVTRAEGLRAVPLANRLRLTSLLISYRNDGDAPASPDGRYGLGQTEWQDLDAAVTFARSHGARRIVLMGWSMGGATVLQFLLRSSQAHRVAAIVLESAVIDWRRVLRHQARLMGLPAPVRSTAMGLLERRWASRLTGRSGVLDFNRLDAVRQSHTLALPILVLHSDGDYDVPIDGALALAAARPDLVQLERFAFAGHTRLWNYDPARWERAITVWLSSVLPAPSGRTARRHRP